MHIDDGQFSVQGTGGSSQCGGLHLDSLLLSFLLNKLGEKGYGIGTMIENENKDEKEDKNKDKNIKKINDENIKIQGTTTLKNLKNFRNLNSSEIQDPLKSKLLLICRKAKEALSDININEVSVVFPAILVRTDEYVPLKSEDGSWIDGSEGACALVRTSSIILFASPLLSLLFP